MKTMLPLFFFKWTVSFYFFLSRITNQHFYVDVCETIYWCSVKKIFIGAEGVYYFRGRRYFQSLVRGSHNMEGATITKIRYMTIYLFIREWTWRIRKHFVFFSCLFWNLLNYYCDDNLFRQISCMNGKWRTKNICKKWCHFLNFPMCM